MAHDVHVLATMVQEPLTAWLQVGVLPVPVVAVGVEAVPVVAAGAEAVPVVEFSTSAPVTQVP